MALLLSLIVTAVVVMCGMLVGHYLLGFRSITPDTYTSFECGFDGLDYNSESLDCELLFFVLIFLVFDLELIMFIYWCANPTLLSLECGSLVCILAVFVTSTLHELYARLIDSEVSLAI